ncbi:MAG: hypothetical protein CMI16_07725 [Opitutaceae bacterium]|nr:hypothetical protein [Opitutaceae bacterium]
MVECAVKRDGTSDQIGQNRLKTTIYGIFGKEKAKYRSILTKSSFIREYGLWMQPDRRYEAKQDIFARLSVTFAHFSVVSKNQTILPLSDFQPPFEVVRTRQVGFIDTLMRRIVELESEP